MKMPHKELDELVRLLEKFEKDELVQRIDNGEIKTAIQLKN